jgi:predicted hydrocarbon binding protein
MFNRFSITFKGLKNIAIDTQKSHLTLKGSNYPLVILRPYDLVQLGALVGSGSEDILIWTGKSIGKNLCQAVMEINKIKKRDKLIQAVVETLSNLGFGKFSINYSEGKSCIIRVSNPISSAIKDKNDAKVLCNLYNGIFIGMLSGSGVEVDGEEIECVLEGKKECVFEYKFKEGI